MELDLSEFAATLVAGAYLFSTLFAVVWLYWPGVCGWAKRSLQELPFKPTLLGLALCFAGGIFIERISNYVSDEASKREIVLRDEKQIRAEVFYRRFVRDYCRHEAVVRDYGGPEGEVLLLAQKASMPMFFISFEPPSVANQLYFEAKSAAYEVDPYHKDLSLSQAHNRFIRSFAVLSFGGALLALPMAIGGVFRMALDGWSKGDLKKVPWVSLARGPLILLLFLGLWQGGRATYTFIEKEFDKRVFGYYLHLVRKAAGEKPPATTKHE